MNPPAKNFLARAFPVPKSLLLTDMSVSICGGSLCFLRMEISRGKLFPKDYGRYPLPVMDMDNIDPKSRAEAAVALESFARAKGARLVRALMHEESAYAFRVTVPTTDPRELRSAIESVLEENVPVPPAEASFEYEIISRDFVRGETTLGVSAVSEKVIAAHADLLAAGGLTPVSFETEARALAKVLFREGERGASLVISMRQGHTLLFIAENGAVVFSSTLEGRPGPAILQSEIGKVIVFWRANEKKMRDFQDISRIIALGAEDSIAALQSGMPPSIKLPVETGFVWGNILSVEERLPGMPKEDSLDFGPLIGAFI